MMETSHYDIPGENGSPFVVPAGTAKEIMALLHREIVKIVALPDVKEKLAVLGFEAVANSPTSSRHGLG
jgi:hypothetical protein